MKSIFALLILLSGFGYGQTPECFEGSAVLRSGERLRGCLLVDQVHDVVIFRKANRELVYPAHKVERVRYVERDEEATREFVSVLQKRNSATYYDLYETVLSGTMSVLREYYTTNVNLHQQVEGFRYFVYLQGEVLPMRKFKSLVYRGLADASPELKSFVKRNRLDIKFSADLIKVVDFCNQAFAGAELGSPIHF